MSAFRVGLSTTTLQPARLVRGLDGIGVYTKHLYESLPQLDVEVVGRYFPGRAPVGPSVGEPFPRAFGAQAVLGMLGSKLMPRDQIALFHFTDYRVVPLTCPVIATLHDAVPLKHPEWTSHSLRRIKNFQIRQSAKYADGVIALSQAEVPDLVECFGIEERRISVVPCGVDPEWFESPALSDVARELSAHGLEPGYFLFVGTLQPRKNVLRILDAYDRLARNVRSSRQLVIVGRPGWRCEEEVVRLKAERAAGTNVIWLDALPGRDALRRIFAGAGVFVFPSLHEGFGIPVLEAFASGIPVVTSNISSLPEVSGGAAVEVDPHDIDSIAEGMARLAEDDSLRACCIVRGRTRARSLTWENTARRTLEVYRQFG